MKVINFLGGPGSTKSTTAVGVFYELKRRRITCEYVHEFAKDLAWEGRVDTMRTDQLYILGEQNHRQHILRGKVDYIVTDTSLLTALVYTPQDCSYRDTLIRLAIEVYSSYYNLNVFIDRPPIDEYETSGRIQDASTATIIDQQLLDALDHHKIHYMRVAAGRRSVDTIIDELLYPGAVP